MILKQDLCGGFSENSCTGGESTTDKTFNANKIIKQFTEAATSPYQWFGKYTKETNNTVIGYFCSYFPEELVAAAQLIPFRIDSQNFLNAKIDNHLQNYCCYVIKNALGQLFDGKLDFIQGVIFPHSCDSMQCLSDIWEVNSNFRLHINFNMPTKLDSQYSRSFLLSEITQLKTELESFTGLRITEEDIRVSSQKYNQLRRLLRRINDLRIENPDLMTRIQLHHIFRAVAIIPVDESLGLLKNLVANLSTTEVFVEDDRKRLYLTGSVFSDERFYQLVEDINAVVIDDDLCNGRRYFERNVKNQYNILGNIVDSLVDKIQCPCKLKFGSKENRAESLIQNVRLSRAHGVIFYHYKYCEPHFFDYPYMYKILKANNIPSILLEVEKPGFNHEQFRSRLESFLEMLTDE